MRDEGVVEPGEPGQGELLAPAERSHADRVPAARPRVQDGRAGREVEIERPAFLARHQDAAPVGVDLDPGRVGHSSRTLVALNA